MPYVGFYLENVRYYYTHGFGVIKFPTPTCLAGAIVYSFGFPGMSTCTHVHCTHHVCPIYNENSKILFNP